jgi:hypothetical protein
MAQVGLSDRGEDMPFEAVSFAPVATTAFPEIPAKAAIPRDNVRVKNIAMTVDWDNPTFDANSYPLFKVYYANLFEVGHWSLDGSWVTDGTTVEDNGEDLLSTEMVGKFPIIATLAPQILGVAVAIAKDSGSI